MRIAIPYLIFEVKGKEYMIDAYFSKKVERIERVSALIRPFDRSLRRECEGSLEPLIKEEDLEGFLKEVFREVYELSGEKLKSRLSHMRRWNIFRLLGLPTGYKRHLKEEEELAKENREALLALAILKNVLGIKSPKELENLHILVRGYRYYAVEIGESIYNEKGKEDKIYAQLLKIDESFKKEIERMAHFFE
ncbi:hypothetical protein PAP_00145 [Palaeococcus pacificus DY20341]|uniref:Uncharacterized protein n=1 Tax=Palaeococcus pacificus DY20341 TaxID=1343739 RepID=A0A075LQS7_9EURY|nr:hypothetical protein [Palaeococcus pacificus]AIF68476.1 hypothetical protein PAP_00145 [Palaeococcus pacificus DY20341]